MDLARLSIVVSLALVALLLIGLELFTRLVVERSSKVQRMVNQEYQEAIHLRRTPGSKSKDLLIVGNSLVGEDLDFTLLEKGLRPNWRVHRYWIFNTAYPDWYFGLRRLLEEGSRPDKIAVVFAAMHWYAQSSRGDYASQYMFQTADLPEISSTLRLDRTTASSLYFARFSKFYALRSDIRKVFLQSFFPDLPRMYKLFKPTAGRHVTDAEIVGLMAQRMTRVRELVERYGSSLVIVVPPVPRSGEEHQEALRVSARRAGVEIVIPMSERDLPAQKYADDVHLSPEGAKLYTAKVVTGLRSVLEQPAAQASLAAR